MVPFVELLSKIVSLIKGFLSLLLKITLSCLPKFLVQTEWTGSFSLLSHVRRGQLNKYLYYSKNPHMLFRLSARAGCAQIASCSLW